MADLTAGEMPKRIQLRRTKGWRKPEGAIVVSRPTRWGNPFSIMDIGQQYPSLTADQCAGMAVAELRDLINAHGYLRLRVLGEVRYFTYPSRDEIRAELAGHDLACWCDPSSPCHADLLLAIANGAES